MHTYIHVNHTSVCSILGSHSIAFKNFYDIDTIEVVLKQYNSSINSVKLS